MYTQTCGTQQGACCLLAIWPVKRDLVPFAFDAEYESYTLPILPLRTWTGEVSDVDFSADMVTRIVFVDTDTEMLLFGSV